MGEELIAGFMSSNIARGTLRGYGIYVTTDRIIGVKGGWKEKWGVALGAVLFSAGGAVFGPVLAGAGAAAGAALGEKLSSDDATKAVELLEEKKDFEVRKEELKEVRVQRKKGALKRMFTWWGDLTIKTAKETYTIRLIKGDTGEVQMLKDMFTAFYAQKFVVGEQGK